MNRGKKGAGLPGGRGLSSEAVELLSLAEKLEGWSDGWLAQKLSQIPAVLHKHLQLLREK